MFKQWQCFRRVVELSPLQIDWLNAGVEHFNAGRFWHAHEDWEHLWKSLKGVAGQDLVDGVTNLWTKASAKLEPVIDGLFGIDVSSLYSESEPFHSDVEQFKLVANSVKIKQQS